MSTASLPRHHDLSVEGVLSGKSIWRSFSEDKVSFRMRRLEPQLAWAIAAYTAWAALFLDPAQPAPWLVTAIAAAIGIWSRMFPAHDQALLLARGVLLLGGAFVLQVSADVGGPTGPYFVWPVMVTAVYALLLPGRWAMLLTGLALAQFVAACLLAEPLPSWRAAGAQAGVLCFFALVAILFSRSMRQLDAQNELAHMDRNTRLYNRAGFLTHGAELFNDCRRNKRPFAMVLLNSADLHDVSDLVGKNPANQLFAQLVQHIIAATPREGLAARTDAVEFGLILPGITAERAATLLRQRLGDPPSIEVTLKKTKVTIMLDSVIAEASPDVASLEDMYEHLHGRLLKRFETPQAAAPEKGSSLHGLLDSNPPMPHHARPTVPMSYGKALRHPHR
jgi:GGDEF domain-containing protein